MNQAQLIDAIAEQAAQDAKGGQAITKADVTRVLLAMTGVIHAQLKAGEELTLPGIGKLKVQDKPAKIGRNPKTGAELQIPAKRVPKFTAVKALKDAVGG
ncbi:HU family DNA-binding protein [Chitinimonas sp.]|uniref:HU family DNA-binding protein n=1 Tax=Chitinimonas sp. TaxID=1934313 RepID=UPI0035B16D1D